MENDFIDLEAELQKITETKAEYNAPATSTEFLHEPTNESAGVGATQNEFEPIDETETTDTTTDEDDDESEFLNAEDLTDFIVEGADMVFCNLLPSIYQISLKRDERNALSEWIRENARVNGQTKNIVISENMAKYSYVFSDYNLYLSTLELKPKERKTLDKPLRKVLKKINFKTDPKNALIGIAIGILIPRLFPIVKNKFL